MLGLFYCLTFWRLQKVVIEKRFAAVNGCIPKRSVSSLKPETLITFSGCTNTRILQRARLILFSLAYNKWHETELERWLSDNNVPYPTPADRKDLENLVKKNWNDKIGTPYKEWETPQLQSYLKSKGAESKKAADSNKNSLINSVKNYWTDGADSATDSYHSVKDWIFDRYPSTPDFYHPWLTYNTQLDRLSAESFPRQAQHPSSTASQARHFDRRSSLEL